MLYNTDLLTECQNSVEKSSEERSCIDPGCNMKKGKRLKYYFWIKGILHLLRHPNYSVAEPLPPYCLPIFFVFLKCPGYFTVLPLQPPPLITWGHQEAVTLMIERDYCLALYLHPWPSLSLPLSSFGSQPADNLNT